MIPVHGLAPLLAVFDMPTSLRFYRDQLGFELVDSAPPGASGDRFGWALLRLGTAELMLNTAYDDDDRPEAPDPADIEHHADVTIFFGCPDLDAAYTHLRERGVDVTPPELTSYGFKAISLTDPDGFGLCFHWPAG